jgi:hypothetical protein
MLADVAVRDRMYGLRAMIFSGACAILVSVGRGVTIGAAVGGAISTAVGWMGVVGTPGWESIGAADWRLSWQAARSEFVIVRLARVRNRRRERRCDTATFLCIDLEYR